LGGWLHGPADARAGVRSGLSWGPLVAQVNYEPPVTRGPARLESLGGSLGAEYTLLDRRHLILAVRVGIDLENQNAMISAKENASHPDGGALHTTDGGRPPRAPRPSITPPSESTPGELDLWLVGPQGGLRAAIPVWAGLRAGVAFDLRWLFAATASPSPADDGMDGLAVGFGFFLGYAI
jgi:hypothetical protein